MAAINKFAGDLPITIEQGATFSQTIKWLDETSTPVDNTGYTACAQIRKGVNDGVVIHEMSTSNGGIVLGGATGDIDLLISHVSTAQFTFSNAVWDLEMTEPPVAIGGASTADSNDAGTTLNDADASFVTNGVVLRDVVENTTDGSVGVIGTVAEGVITHTQLVGGTLNTWTAGDVYRIIPRVRRLVEGKVTLDKQVTRKGGANI